MADSSPRSSESRLAARLKSLLDSDTFAYIDDASHRQKRSLLMLLEELWASDEPKLTARLRELLGDKDMLRHIDSASEDQKRKLLILLRDLRASD